MTEAVAKKKGTEKVSAEQAWDAFLVEEGLPPGQADWNRSRLERWHAEHWKEIRTELRNRFGWSIPAGQMPHWTEPGSARYWQQPITRHRVPVDPGNPVGGMRTVEEPGEWAITSPLPANSPEAIDYYLKKGLRFRSPLKGRSVEPLKAADSPGGDEKETEAPAEQPYSCRRHGPDKFYAFPAWKAYLAHINRYGEELEYSLPGDIRSRMKEYRWYCRYHNAGFTAKQSKTMKVHMRGAHVYGVVPLTSDDIEVVKRNKQEK